METRYASGRSVATRTPLTWMAGLSWLLAWVLAASCLLPSAAAQQDPWRTNSYHNQDTYCPVNIAAAARCPAERPVCCLHLAAVRCCPLDDAKGCNSCKVDTPMAGYELAQGTAMLGMMALTVILMMGSIVTSGIGRHCAWQLERHRVIKEYKERQALRRKEARDFKRELEETERSDVPEGEACVICCSRYLDCALIPCGHVCSCRFCAKRLKECPVCRVAVEMCYRLPDYLIRQLAAANRAEGGTGDSANSSSGAAQPLSSANADGLEREGGAGETHVTLLDGAPTAQGGPPPWAAARAGSDTTRDIVVIERETGEADGEDEDEEGGRDARQRHRGRAVKSREEADAGEEMAHLAPLPSSRAAVAVASVPMSAAAAATRQSSAHPTHAYTRLAVMADEEEAPDR